MARHFAPRPVHASRRRPLLVVLLTLGLMGVASAAFAYWTAQGHGIGSATVGTLAAPTGVTATSTAGSTTVSVSWTASSGSPTPQGYYVVRTNTSTSATALACGTSATTLTSATSCSDTSVPDGSYTYAVTAVYKSWTAKSAASASVMVSGVRSTTTTLASSSNPSLVGQTVTYTATVSSTGGTPTGSVAFQDAGSGISCTGGNQTLSGGTATCSVSYASAGSHAITATYGGATGYASSTSSLTQEVQRAATSTSLSSTPNAPVVGQSVTLTATVASSSGVPSGTVAFSEGNSPITCSSGNQTLSSSGQATCTVAFASAGSHPVTATYSGATAFAPSSSVLTQSVTKAATSTTLTSSANPAIEGQSVVLSVTVAATSPGAGTPAGTVDVKDGPTAICSGLPLSGGHASCTTSTLSVGSHSLTAVYSGSLDYIDSTSTPPLSQEVNAQPTTVTALTLANKTGGTAGRAEAGDVVSVTFSRGLRVSSVYSGWSGDSTNQTTTATVTISSGSNNVLTVTNAANTLKIGSIDLGSGAYVTSPGQAGKNLTFTNSTVLYNPTTRVLTITLGTLGTGGQAGTQGTVASSIATLTVDGAVRDVNGSALSPLTFATVSGQQF